MPSTLPLAIGTFAIGMTEFVIMGLLPDVARDLRVSVPQAGWLITSYALGVVVGAPVLTLSLRRLSTRTTLAGLIFAFALANLLTTLLPSYGAIAMSRFLAGLPHGAFFGISAVVASRMALQGREGQAVASVFTGLTVANLVGVPAGTWLGQHFGWRVAFDIVAVIAVLSSLSIWRFIPALTLPGSASVAQELAVLRNPQFARVMGVAMIGFGGMFAGLSYIAPLITQSAHLSAAAVTPLMIWAGAGMVCGNILSGRLLSGGLGAGQPLRMTRILLVALAGMCALLDLSVTVTPLFVLSIALFTAVGFAMPATVQTLTIKLSRGAEALASATNHSAFNIGNALGAFLGGLPMTLGYPVTAAPWVGVALALGGLAIATTIQEQGEQEV